MRAEFSKKTKRLVAERAGYRCSFPNCNRLTVGPSKRGDKSNIIGIAAHIYGAAISGAGPRGVLTLSSDELSSAKNAIWLCAEHASLIDKQKGADFSAGTLISYKDLHETRIALELSGMHSRFGWTQKLTIHSSPLFIDGVQIEFAKLNLVVGGNSVGKTSLCEWIAGSYSPTYLERWEKTHPCSQKRLSLSIDFFDPDHSTIGIDFLNDNYPRYCLNGLQTLVTTKIINVVFPEQLDLSVQEFQNDRDAVVKSLKLHHYELQALFDKLGESSDFFKGAYFKENEDCVYMHVELQSDEGLVSRPLRLLSSSEQEWLMLELGLIAANKLAMTGPTILILDANSWKIDTDWLNRHAKRFNSPECRFQTIVSTRSTDINFEEVSWTGWKVIRLEGTPPDADIKV